MSIGIYYHWWEDPNEVEPYKNIRLPILLSIATQRAHNPTIPITVLQHNSTDPKRWSYFPDKLNFQVLPIDFTLEKRHSDKAGWKHLSRLFDLEIHANADIVIYSDVDVFWFKDALPLYHDPHKMCFNGNNTGLFYYDRHSDNVKQFFEIFKAFTLSALYDESIRKLMRTHTYDGWYYVFDEMTCSYMFLEQYRHLFNQLSVNEHCCPRNLHEVSFNFMKTLHCNGLLVSDEGVEHRRGICCIVFKELYDAICKVLDNKDLSLIFANNEIERLLPYQFSLYQDYQRVTNTKLSDGHYRLPLKKLFS
jgi:hypothetical protein